MGAELHTDSKVQGLGFQSRLKRTGMGTSNSNSDSVACGLLP